MKNILYSLYAVVSLSMLLSLPSLALAQGAPTDPSDVPIDGGLSLLLAAGLAYGGKKAYDARKKQKNDEK